MPEPILGSAEDLEAGRVEPPDRKVAENATVRGDAQRVADARLGVKSSIRRGVNVATSSFAPGPSIRIRDMKLKSNKAAAERQLMASARTSP